MNCPTLFRTSEMEDQWDEIGGGGAIRYRWPVRWWPVRRINVMGGVWVLIWGPMRWLWEVGWGSMRCGPVRCGTSGLGVVTCTPFTCSVRKQSSDRRYETLYYISLTWHHNLVLKRQLNLIWIYESSSLDLNSLKFGVPICGEIWT